MMSKKDKIKELENKLKEEQEKSRKMNTKLELLSKLNGRDYILEDATTIWSFTSRTRITYVYKCEPMTMSLPWEKESITVSYCSDEYFIFQVRDKERAVNNCFLVSKDESSNYYDITEYIKSFESKTKRKF